ncbi:MAG: formylglycine-generating enzyme family protein [Deltaproteobacteria bacterium]|nr:formylglycine-generating enzyme family protein [Deltaproteobacteria bacterium]
MVWIPGGAFERGCEDVGCAEEEGPARELVVSGFAIDIHEVTVADYALCMLASDAPCSPPARVWEGEGSPYNFDAPKRCGTRSMA